MCNRVAVREINGKNRFAPNAAARKFNEVAPSSGDFVCTQHAETKNPSGWKPRYLITRHNLCKRTVLLARNRYIFCNSFTILNNVSNSFPVLARSKAT